MPYYAFYPAAEKPHFPHACAWKLGTKPQSRRKKTLSSGADDTQVTQIAKDNFPNFRRGRLLSVVAGWEEKRNVES